MTSRSAKMLIVGLVLAAGLSKRMGAPKQTLAIAGKPMLAYVVNTFLASELDEIILVIRKGLSSPRARPRLKVAVNPHPEYGISESLKVGIRALGGETRALVVGLGDKPLLLPSSINSVIAAYESLGPKIIVPTYRGERGNPVLLDRSLFPALMHLRGDVGAREVIESHPNEVKEIQLDDEGIILDVNEPQDIETITRIIELRHRSGRK